MTRSEARALAAGAFASTSFHEDLSVTPRQHSPRQLEQELEPAEAEHILVAYDWPGNVRELQNEVQRVVIQADPGGFITPDLLSSRMRRGEELVDRAGASRGSLKETLVEVEKYLVYEALRAHDNNKTNTAKTLGITREGLYRKLKRLGIQ